MLLWMIIKRKNTERIQETQEDKFKQEKKINHATVEDPKNIL